jgi:hypothetical protein
MRADYRNFYMGQKMNGTCWLHDLDKNRRTYVRIRATRTTVSRRVDVQHHAGKRRVVRLGAARKLAKGRCHEMFKS